MNEWRSALKAPWKQLWEEIGVYQPFSRVSSGKNAYTGRFCLHVHAHPGAPPYLHPLITANASKTKSVLCDRWARAWSHRFLNYRSKWTRDKTGFHWTNNPLLVFFVFFFLIFLLIYAWKFWINFWPPLKRLKKWGVGEGSFREQCQYCLIEDLPPDTNREKLYKMGKILPVTTKDMPLSRPTFFDNAS